MKDPSQEAGVEKNPPSATHRILTVVGILLCIVLLPILAVNVTLLVKGYTNTDRVPDIGSYIPMIVLSGSMSPEFESGDLIITKAADPQKIEVGDVISFFDPDGNGTSVVTHRVLEVIEPGEDAETLSFRTMGDANLSEDLRLVPAEKVIGVYQGIRIRGAGSVAMFMQTTQGLIVCVFLPLVLLVGYDILRRRKYEKRHENDRDELLAELAELRRLQGEKGRTEPEEVVMSMGAHGSAIDENKKGED